MDEIMYKHLKADKFNRLVYTLANLKLKERSSERPGAFVCDAQGTLAVAGKTNELTMPVTVAPLTERRLQVTGNTKLKMTDFDITPPAPALAGGAIKTGDEVMVRFVWTVERR
jgi:polyisoprenoid-binding protein YceI